MLHYGIRAGEKQPFVAIIPPHHVRRIPLGPVHSQYFTVTPSLTDMLPTNVNAVAY